ncbi:MAG: glycerol-3-phosphate 1-O-acyltransferase PlsY [Boseongicola sp.]|nr:glycerol-3-phosphate 1-O-acyltransferase PlsY [Boseongicola sp.]MDD9977804.1 glycerol-3-phosphate 1-O-acyltransferase PlsY [Boseongicola sp.]
MTPEIVSSPVALGLVVVAGYLLGSVPFGLVIARVFGLGDLRQIGSGNIGATNVLRTGNKLAAFLTLVLDSGKGAIAVLAARFLVGEDAAQFAGGAAFLGHLFPIILGFKGGKGVATYLGTLLALSFWVGLAACMTWLIVALVFRISSLSALVAALAAPALAYFLGYPTMVWLAGFLGVLIWWRHKDNILRLLNGTESKISFGK